MIIIDSSKTIKQKTTVAIGNFDGVHLGHRALINRMLELAVKKELKSVICTFNNHTSSVVKSQNTPKLIMNNEQKINILRNMKVDYIYMIDFNEEIMNLSPKDFAQKYLVERLNSKLVVVGFNFKFGHKATGDVKYLKKLGREMGYEVEIIPPLYKNNKVISSTYIRQLISLGNIKLANELLARPYSIKGKVVCGKGIGKIIGFPTANIEMMSNYVIPKSGVYKTVTKINGKSYLSITSIGNNPTFNENKISIETHIINFNNNLYNEILEIFFLEYIREEKKFKSKEELAQQILADLEYVKLSN